MPPSFAFVSICACQLLNFDPSISCIYLSLVSPFFFFLKILLFPVYEFGLSTTWDFCLYISYVYLSLVCSFIWPFFLFPVYIWDWFVVWSFFFTLPFPMYIWVWPVHFLTLSFIVYIWFWSPLCFLAFYFLCIFETGLPFGFWPFYFLCIFKYGLSFGFLAILFPVYIWVWSTPLSRFSPSPVHRRVWPNESLPHNPTNVIWQLS